MLGADLTAIPTIGVETALTFAAEIGADLSRFPSAGHFCSWLGLSPGTRISGDKRLGGPPMRRTNRVGQALRMAASTARNRKTTLGAAHRRRLQRMDPDALCNLARDADGVASHHEGLAIVGNRVFGQRIQVAQNIVPLGPHASVVHAAKELVAQHQREERAEDMSADGGIGLMEDGAGVEKALGGAEYLLDHPQLLVA